VRRRNTFLCSDSCVSPLSGRDARSAATKQRGERLPELQARHNGSVAAQRDRTPQGERVKKQRVAEEPRQIAAAGVRDVIGHPPPALERSMGENWRDCQAYKKHNSELTADAGSEE
jgi:hypothetical protein